MERTEKGAKGVMHLTGLTDNSGNTAALCRLMSSKFQLVVILTEFASQPHCLNVELDLLWVPRTQNEEADGLTNGRFEFFSASRRLDIEVEKLSFLVLDDMLAVSDQLYKDVQSRRDRAKAEAKTGTDLKVSEVLKKKPFKERDPW